MARTTTYKGTKKDNFNALLAIPAVQENTNLVEFINHELELLANKKSGKVGVSKAVQAQREEDYGRIIALLTEKGGLSSTAIFRELGFSSGQYATSRLKEMVQAGKVVRTQDKKNITFDLARKEG